MFISATYTDVQQSHQDLPSLYEFIITVGNNSPFDPQNIAAIEKAIMNAVVCRTVGEVIPIV